MRELLEELIYTNFRKILTSDRINELKNTARMNQKRLKRNLGKEQRKLLLRIGDTKDLIAEVCGYESFIAGFKIGLKIGYETNKD